jgi:clan AA aspartic protease (TIGR02281 family)
MRLLCCTIALASMLAVGTAGAEIYRWTDAEGRVHFTQDLSQVPARYRKQAEERAREPVNRGRVQTYSGRSDSGSSSPPAKRGASSDTGKVYKIAVQRAGTSMMVAVRLNDSVTAPFLLDTGASDVLVPESVAKELGLNTGAASRTKRYSTANGIVEHPVVMLRSVSLGGAVVENVPASVSPNMDIGLLGLSFFNHFTYNIDAAAGVVTLIPNRLAVSGQIRGGRSEAQWRSEYRNLHARLEAIEREYARKPESRSRERQRLEAERADLERQLTLLDDEADFARVPMVWRD